MSSAVLSSSVVRAGATVTISGGCFGFGVLLQITLFSTPVSLGTVTAGTDGSYRATVTIPADTTPGRHRIEVVGPGRDGGIHRSTAELTVLRASGALPRTGQGIDRWSRVGWLLTGMGVLLVVVARQVVTASGLVLGLLGTLLGPRGAHSNRRARGVLRHLRPSR